MGRYDDVEALLHRGFLSARCDMFTIPIVFKTLTQVEFDLVLMQGEDLSRDWRVHTGYYLAYSTLFFNRQLLLPVRQFWVTELAELYASLPDRILVVLLLMVNRINQRSRDALEQVQAYSYGAASRERWASVKGLPLCDSRVTGIEGTEKVGLTYHQRLWSYLNRAEDEQEHFLRMYGLAKFITSPHAPKEIQKMDRKDAKKIKEMNKVRRKLFEGRAARLGDDDREVRVSAESAEELLEQMERTLRGEKDYHDLVIEAHQKKVRQAYIAREEERQRLAKMNAARREQALMQEASARAFEGLTRQEVEHLIRKQRQESAQMRQESTWIDPDALAAQEQNLLRWGFLEVEDIPSNRREWYNPAKHTVTRPGEDDENPLMDSHYERVHPERED